MTLLEDLLRYRPLLLSSALLAFAVNYILSRLQEIATHRRRKTSDTPIEPPVVPCWIPYVGSSIEMGQGSLAFIRKYSSKYSSPIFSATIAGDVCHFIADSNLAALPYKSTTALDAAILVKHFLTRVAGADESMVDEANADGFVVKASMTQFHQHVLKRKATETNLMNSQKILKEHIAALREQCLSRSSNIPLYQLCLETIFAASVSPILSESFGTNANAHAFHDWLNATPLLCLPSFCVKECEDVPS